MSWWALWYLTESKYQHEVDIWGWTVQVGGHNYNHTTPYADLLGSRSLLVWFLHTHTHIKSTIFVNKFHIHIRLHTKPTNPILIHNQNIFVQWQIFITLLVPFICILVNVFWVLLLCFKTKQKTKHQIWDDSKITFFGLKYRRSVIWVDSVG